MKNEEPATETARVLVVGRSPSVLIAAVRLLRDKGYRADVTNQFDQVLDDYDVTDLDILVFGGMVPPETKQRLSEEITSRNAGITVIQGLAGIPGVIAAQVEEATSRDSGEGGEGGDVTYDQTERTLRIVLDDAEHVTVEALWGTSFTPPEPTSTSMRVFDGDLPAAAHDIALPDHIPDVAAFAAITVGARTRVLTIGPMPQTVNRMAPKSSGDRRLPEVAAVTTHSQDQ